MIRVTEENAFAAGACLQICGASTGNLDLRSSPGSVVVALGCTRKRRCVCEESVVLDYQAPVLCLKFGTA